MNKFDESVFYCAIVAACPLIFILSSLQFALVYSIIIAVSTLLSLSVSLPKTNMILKTSVICFVSIAITLLCSFLLGILFPKLCVEIGNKIYIVTASSIVLNVSIARENSKHHVYRIVASLSILIIVVCLIGFMFELFGNGSVWNRKYFDGVEFFGSTPFGYIVLGSLTFLFNVAYAPFMHQREIYDNLVLHYKTEIIEKEDK